MSDDEVIDLAAASDDEVALKEEDQLSLANFGLPDSQQPADSDHAAYISAPAPSPRPFTDADAAFAEALQRRELDLAMEEEKNQRTATAPHFTSSSSSSPFSSGPSALIALHHEHLSPADPFVNVHALFGLYSQLFFNNSLPAVSVRWSNRMTLCAGLCRYDDRGGGCEIALSESLLRYRSKQEVVETLLHEMIHAYLFVGDTTQRDHDAHGPNFCAHMRRINEVLGLRITVYHTFYAEIRQFKRFVWQCQGKCKDWKPYFGKVSRAMNRKPGPYDIWWKQHANNCGGYFVKIKGPTEAELKAERKEKATRKRQEKRREKERVVKREEEKEDSSNGLRQTHLWDTSTTTPQKKRKKEEKKGEDAASETGEDAKTEDEGTAKKKSKPRRSKKKFPGKGHVLGGGEEEPKKGTKRRKKKAEVDSTDRENDSDFPSLSMDDMPSASESPVAVHRSPTSPAATSSSSSSQPFRSPSAQPSSASDPPISVTPAASSAISSASSSSPSFSSSFTGIPLLSVSASPVKSSSSSSARGSAAKAAGGTDASTVRRRTTNIFDLMAARGEGRKVDELAAKLKNPS